MANWYGHARSNYFRVKDEAAFREALSVVDLEIHSDKEGRFCVLSNDEYGGWPGWIYTDDPDQEDDIEFDLPLTVADHLAPGEVAVFMEIGAEKLRYVTGIASAVNDKGELRIVNLDSIYELAKELGENITTATY